MESSAKLAHFSCAEQKLYRAVSCPLQRRHIITFILIKIIVQFYWVYWKRSPHWRNINMQRVFKGFTAKICGLSLLAILTLWVFTLWHITLVLYSKRKSSISAPADQKVISKQARLNATKSILVIIIGQGKSLLRRQITQGNLKMSQSARHYFWCHLF